jgi:hypothetical protein
MFVIKTTIYKYLRFKVGWLCWCFVGTAKTSDSIEREALWHKMRRRGSNYMVNCIKEM